MIQGQRMSHFKGFKRRFRSSCLLFEAPLYGISMSFDCYRPHGISMYFLWFQWNLLDFIAWLTCQRLSAASHRVDR